MGAPCFRADFCSKTIIPDSQEHPLASSRAVPKAVLRWIRGKEKLEIAAEEARALLKERRQFLDSADTIAAFAAEMSEFLKTSELTETKAFVGSFVKEVVVKPGRAAIVYSIPTPEDSPIGGADAAEIALNGGVMNSVRHGGPGRDRTCDRSVMSRSLYH